MENDKKSLFTNDNLFRNYLRDIEKYPLMKRKQLLEEYKNINLKNEIVILTNGVLDVDKLFSYISCLEDYNIVVNYIKLHCINNYPQTNIDKELINKLNTYNLKYSSEKIDIENQLIKYEKYKNSKEKVINSNLRLVISVAKNYANHCDMMDIISAGNEGLMKAVDKFNSDRDTQFSTYASYWIRKSIVLMINDTSKLIRIPLYLKTNYINMSKNINNVILRKGDKLTIPEMAKELGIKEEELRKYYNDSCVENISSYNSLISENGETYEAFFEDKNDPYEEINSSVKETLEELLAVLNDKERFVIEHKNGLNTEVMSINNIAESLNITRQTVKAIENRAMEKLKRKSKRISW